ncbi:MAG: cobalamin-binding protein [bacterium]|nr:cobalamin-binding protein [bacterium]
MVEEPQSTQAVLARVCACVQAGKSDANTDIPPGSLGQPGVAEWVEMAIERGASPQTILEEALTAGMNAIGKRFAANEVFIPEVLIAARSMHVGLAKLKPLFVEQGMPSRGVLVIGTVLGDLHDIGKNLVGMLFEGAGWKVIDLGVDCPAEKFLAAVAENPGCAVGLSALLTTTMVSMGETVKSIRAQAPQAIILVGGAPVTEAYAREIGASGYAPDPAAAIELLDSLLSDE